MNDHRYNLFFAKNGEIESHQLPPCKDSLQRTPCGQTIKRVFGGAVCSVAHQSSTQLDADGRWEVQRKTKSANSLDGGKACSRVSAGASCMQMFRIVQTVRRPCVDCRTQAAQEDVEVIVDGDSEEEDEGGY